MYLGRINSVSSELLKLEGRIKTLESSTTGIATTSSAVSTTTTPDDEGAQSGTDFAGTSAPYTYKQVVDAYIYGPKVTGNTSRAEIYFEEDPGIAQAEYVQIQGIHGNTADEIDVSGTFKVYAIDEDPWDDDVRATQPWRDEPGVGVTNTVWYNPVVVPPSDSPVDQGLQLITTRLIDSVSATGTTVTVTLNSAHRFAVGDVLYFDLPTSLLDGYTDKLFRVSNVVNSTTIEYELESALGSPISLNSGDLGSVYVYPVAHKYVADGTTWTDTSVEPNKVYIWNDYRWYDTTDAAVAEAGGADTIAPSPVANLSATSAVTTPAGPTTSGRSSVTLTWDAPTTNENSTTLEDLGGYSVWWRYTVSEEWRINEIDDPDITTWYQDDFVYNVTVLFAVYAKDKFGNRSTATTTSVSTAGTPATALVEPSAPTITGYLGTMKVYWDGLDANGDPASDEAFEVQLHISATSGFTADASTLFERFPAINGATYTVIPGNAQIGGSSIVDGQTYYFKFKFVDIWGNTTSESLQGSFDAQTSDIVTFDMIDVGTVTGEILIGADIRTSSTPSSNGGITLDSTGLTAYNNVGVQTFNISAATGAIDITGYATDGELSAVNSVAISANGIAVTANNTANNAQSVAITANGIAVTANNSANSAITIANGKITIGGAAADVNNNTTTISGGKITTGTVEAAQLSSGSLTGFLIAGNDIATSTGNPRVKMNNAGFFMFNSSASPVVRMYTANGTAYLSGDVYVDGYINGALRTSTSFPRVELESSTYNGLRFRYNSTSSNRMTSSSGSVTLNADNFDITNLGSQSNSNSYYVVVSPFSGRLVRGGIYSDRRLKTDIYDLPLGLDFINSISPVTFAWKKDSKKNPQVGVIAQDLANSLANIDESYVPLFVGESSDVPLDDGSPSHTVNYSRFIPVLLKAVKELSAQVDELKDEVEYLKNNQEK